MAGGIYGYLFCVLCFCDFFYLTHAVCLYMKQDIAYKVWESDIVLTGTVTNVMDGDSKYFPGIKGAKTVDMNVECIYKGPAMSSVAKIYGAGLFQDSAGGCHNTTVSKDRETIVYLQKKENGDLLMKFVNDPIYYMDELTICGIEKPKLVTDHAEPDYAEDICPWAGEGDCVRYVTTKAPTTMVPTPKPTPEPETTKKPEEPKSTIKYNVNSVKPQAKDNDDGGVASVTSMTSLLVISSLLAYLLV